MAREQYRYFASVYDRMMDNIPYKEWKQYVLKLFYKYGVPPCADITELGCGTGVMTRLLAKDGFNMTGIDISEEMLKVAQAKTSDRVLYKLADMRKFSLDHKQDLLMRQFMMHLHLISRERRAREYMGCCKKVVYDDA